MVFHGSFATAIGQLLGLTVIIAAIAGGAAFAYRWGVRERLPDGLAVLVGLSLVAVSVGATGWLSEVIGGSDTLLEAATAIRNIAVFVACAAAANLGARAGDRIARDVVTGSTTGAIDGEVGRLVEAVGRVITVELPEEIEDVVGYDPVSPATKEELEGKRFLFPRRLTVEELRERLVDRLKTDYGVGHVDIDLASDGTVEYLALGSRAAGIGPTLPPETAAVAIRADPAYAASAGDLVQVWERNPSRRVLTAELRGTAGDVVTLAIDAADTPKLDTDTTYRLVTLPVDDRPDREFASLLRAADETMAAVEVGEGSEVVGKPVSELGVTVAAIAHSQNDPATLPTGDRTVAAGDVLYAIGTPEALRKLEAATEPAEDDSIESAPDDEGRTPDNGDDPPPDTAPAASDAGSAGTNVTTPGTDGDGTNDTEEAADMGDEDGAESEANRDAGGDSGADGTGGETTGDEDDDGSGDATDRRP